MKSLTAIFVFAATLGLSSCQSVPVSPEKSTTPVQAVSTTARVLVQDRIQNKNVTLSSESLAIGADRLRMDLTAGFGIPVGRMTMARDQMELLAYEQKKAFYGRPGAGSLRKLAAIEIDPRDLIVVLQGGVPSAWDCRTSPQEQNCEDPKKKLKFNRILKSSWPESKWVLEGKTFSLTFLPTSVSTNVQWSPDSFVFRAPPHFVKENLISN